MVSALPGINNTVAATYTAQTATVRRAETLHMASNWPNHSRNGKNSAATAMPATRKITRKILPDFKSGPSD